MSIFATRVITGTLYGTLLIGCLIGGVYTFSVFFLLITLQGLKEFYRLSNKATVQPQKIMGAILALLTYCMSTLHFLIPGYDHLFIICILFTVFLLFAIELFRAKKNAINNLSHTLLGVFYVGLPMALLPFLAFDSLDLYNYQIILGMFIVVWLSDTGAYLIGVRFGKHKLLERISPKKSWEGFFGGVAAALIGAYILSHYFTILSNKHWIVLGAIISLTAVLGDLIESMFKRSVGVKDSGTLLPGHGGILDRFDSVLFVIPFVYLYLQFFA